MIDYSYFVVTATAMFRRSQQQSVTSPERTVDKFSRLSQRAMRSVSGSPPLIPPQAEGDLVCRPLNLRSSLEKGESICIPNSAQSRRYWLPLRLKSFARKRRIWVPEGLPCMEGRGGVTPRHPLLTNCLPSDPVRATRWALPLTMIIGFQARLPLVYWSPHPRCSMYLPVRTATLRPLLPPQDDVPSHAAQ
ncbi:MAG: hypothetical protein JWN14_124 [Chthonomonadales bacterium]|nr:hypothetical protein [Chthonomonadales bacterium]